MRLQNAAHLLRTTDTSITEIAGICGFSDGNYFGDAFRKHYGMSPRAYRLT
ncbi:MAG: helix-turn-helix transcriptional regulator [Roseburia hominis]